MRILVSFFLSSLLFFSASAGENNKRNIDTNKSVVKWTGEKLAGSHFGTVRIVEGYLEEGPKGNILKGLVVVDMNSIAVDDLKDKDSNKKLTDHLKSEDFFDTAKHKNAVLDISKVTNKGKGLQVMGTLRIKDASHPTTFSATMVGDKHYRATVVFDRTKYGIKYNSGSFFSPKKLKDRLIKDEVKLEVDLRLM